MTKEGAPTPQSGKGMSRCDFPKYHDQQKLNRRAQRKHFAFLNFQQVDLFQPSMVLTELFMFIQLSRPALL